MRPLQRDFRALSYLSAGPGSQGLTGPVRSVTGPVREAVLIKFGSIIAGFVLWPHYGFFNLVNLSSPSPPFPPQPQAAAASEQYQEYFPSPHRGFLLLLLPQIGSQKQDRAKETRGRQGHSGDLKCGFLPQSAFWFGSHACCSRSGVLGGWGIMGVVTPIR